MGHGNTQRNRLIKADIHRVRVGGKFWLFTFSDQWGPLLTDEWADPVDNTPLSNEAHPFWDRFEDWFRARLVLTPPSGLVGSGSYGGISPVADASRVSNIDSDRPRGR